MFFIMLLNISRERSKILMLLILLMQIESSLKLIYGDEIGIILFILKYCDYSSLFWTDNKVIK